ncbi:MAG: sialate O-acetylesterase [Lachnospiraceae bacterium]|nr:sialate O-acetylesterase [Lachnospiraceae bacterium]MDE6184816.1 sialate O-acetylesterase [Lachnospiraceae bacterium]
MKLASLFKNHMIVQRNREIPVWGEGTDGEEIVVRFAGREVKTTVSNGRWEVRLSAMEAGVYEELNVTNGAQTIILTDIAVGEVWIAGGQSNMEFLYKYDAERIPDDLIVEDSLLRFYDVPKVSYEGQFEIGHYEDYGIWRTWRGGDAKWFSAVGAYFGHKLRSELKIPIGIIGCNWGGCNAITWTSPERIAEHSELKEIVKQYSEYVSTLDRLQYERATDYISSRDPKPERDFVDHALMGKSVREFRERLMAEKPEWEREYEALNMEIGPRSFRRPSGLYEYMLKKVLPVEIRGTIWYQGEEDERERAGFYDISLRAVIDTFRDRWPDMPFLAVQLPPFEGEYIYISQKYPVIRRQIEKVAETVPRTWCCCTTDCGDRNNIHPRNKRKVGLRLALLALKHIYKKEIDADSPKFLELVRGKGEITLKFAYAESGLFCPDAEIRALEVIADGCKILPDISFIRDTIVLEDEIFFAAKEIIIRYGMENYSKPNIYAHNGLPLFPFEAAAAGYI